MKRLLILTLMISTAAVTFPAEFGVLLDQQFEAESNALLMYTPLLSHGSP